MAKKEIDILKIDADIRKKFENERLKLPEYHKRVKEIKTTLSSGKLSSEYTKHLEKEVSELEKLIEKIETREDQEFYMADTMEYIQRYQEILRIPIRISFSSRRKVPENPEKKKIIVEYLKKAKKYIDIEEPEMNKSSISPICSNCSNRSDYIIEDNLRICMSCGVQQEIIQNYTYSYSDTERVNISQKYTYDRKIHFRDCIKQFQGKQNCTIDQKVYEDLEDILQRHRIVSKDKTIPRRKRFDKVSKKHILMFLKELGYSKHYENVTLIHYNLTCKKPPDISHLEDKLESDFDQLVAMYDKHFRNKVNRVSFISTQYVLYQLLRKYRYRCKKEDFVILKTSERLSFHDNICKELFQLLGWNFTGVM